MHAIRTAPGGAVVRLKHLRLMVLFVASAGFGCASSDSAILSLESTPVELSITVIPMESGEIMAAPTKLDLEVGQSATLSATAVDVLGQPVGNASVLWTSEDPAVASVDGDGVLSASVPGTTIILATVNGVEAELEVTVTEASTP